MQLKPQLNALRRTLMNMTTIKKWVWVFSSGLSIGLFLGYQFAYWSVIKDCQVMGMFRYADAPLSCTYHLVKLQDYGQVELPKEEKKKK
jgi:hypothetical protein